MPLTRDDRGAAQLGGAPLDALFEPASAFEPASTFEPASAGDPSSTAPTDGPFPTPAYVYDLDGIEASARALAAGFGDAPHLVSYAVKANAAGPILRALRDAGCGATVVSGGELAAALAAGFSRDRIVLNGVAKQAWEIDRALGAGPRGILAIHMESVEEIPRVEARARALGRRARVAIRVNPNVAADTHAGVATGHDEAKFGLPLEDLGAAWEALAQAPSLELVGLSCHIGSQLTGTAEYLRAADLVLGAAAAREASAGPLEYVDFGGGFGIDYGGGCPASPADFTRAVAARVAASPLRGRTILVEPGRCLVAEHGVLCAGVVSAKRTRASATPRRWLMLDAGMNDLVRPAMYGSRHRVEPLESAPPGPGEGQGYRVVGPVCESSDDFGEHRFADPPPRRVVIRDAGAYGFTMASAYNGRALPTEIFLRGGRVVAARRARPVDAWVEDRVGM